MKKIFIILFLIVNSIIFSNDEKPIKVTLQLKWEHQFQFAGYYAAIEKGIYKKYGLDVTLREFKLNMDPINEVLEKRADFGIGMSDIFIRRAEGKPIVLLASIFQHSPLVLIVRKDSGIDSVHKLTGKRVMIEELSAEIFAYLKNEGVDINSIKRMPHTMNTYDIINKKADSMTSYISTNPYVFEKAGVEYNYFTPRSGGIDFYGDSLFTTEDEIKEHPDAVKAFKEASLKGWEYAMVHRDEIIEMIIKKYNPKKTRDELEYEAAKLENIILPGLVEVGHINPGRWQYIADTYKSFGFVKDNSINGFIYDPDKKSDYSFILFILLIFSGIIILLCFIIYPIIKLNFRLKKEIKEKSLMELKLRESETLYHSTVNASPDDITITDMNGFIKFLSPKALEMFGYETDEDILGRNIDEFVSKTDIPKIKYLIERIKTEGFKGPVEIKVIKTDNTEFVIEANAEIVKNADDENNGIVFIIRDITKRKHTEHMLARALEQQRLINSLLQILYRPHDIDKSFDEVLSLIGTYTGITRIYISEVTEDKTGFASKYEWCIDEKYIKNDIYIIPLKYDDIPSWLKIIEEKGYIFYESTDEMPSDIKKIMELNEIKSILAYPINVMGEIWGYIGFDEFVQERKWQRIDIEILNIASSIISKALESFLAEKELKKYANIDIMTGAYNRRMALVLLEKFINFSKRNLDNLSVCFIDLNDLKKVNDRYGHKEGDNYIISISKIITESIRNSDTFCRFGGDEFLIIMPKCDSIEAQKVLERIRQKIEILNYSSIEKYDMSISAGISEYPLGIDISIDELVNRAENKMYKNKMEIKTKKTEGK